MEIETGCVIDCSHLSSDDLNYRIIQFAASLGWDGGPTDIVHLMSDYENGVPEDNEFWGFMSTQELSETLYFTADDAVQWLNESNLAPDGCYWTVDDNSLYLEESNEDV
jgi:hypothetical protein